MIQPPAIMNNGVSLMGPNATPSDGQTWAWNAAAQRFDFVDLPSGGASSPLDLVSNGINELPLNIESSVGQLEDLFQINSPVTSTGDLFRVEANGCVVFQNGLKITADTIEPATGGDLYLNFLGKGTIQFDSSARIIFPSSGAWDLGSTSKPFYEVHSKKFFFIPETDSSRPAAGNAGCVIFNSDDGTLNIDNGTNWTLPDGTVT